MEIKTLTSGGIIDEGDEAIIPAAILRY